MNTYTRAGTNAHRATYLSVSGAAGGDREQLVPLDAGGRRAQKKKKSRVIAGGREEKRRLVAAPADPEWLTERAGSADWGA